MLSGRYRSDKLLSNFHPTNSPNCQLSCDSPNTFGDVPHLLVHCSSLAHRRTVLFEYWDAIVSRNPACSLIVDQMKLAPPALFTQFLLDCSVIPEVISLVQIHGEDVLATLFKLTRTWCYSIHRERLKILKRWRC